MISVTFKIRQDMRAAIHADLMRPHPFAAERVGFIACQLAEFPDGQILVLAQTYLPLPDDHYENDPRVGAMMNSEAIRSALQYSYNRRTAMFHVHCHEHHGPPGFSVVDLTESDRFVPDFWKVRPSLIHGALVFSRDCIHGRWWNPRTKHAQSIDRYVVVGFPTISHQEARRAARPE